MNRCLFVFVCAWACLSQAAKIKVCLVDEEDLHPLPGVKVQAQFTTTSALCGFVNYETVTGEDGCCVVRGSADDKVVWIRPDKYSLKEHYSRSVPVDYAKLARGTVVTVALQRVVNPIPLVYRERAEGKWGTVGEPHEKVLEYDLLKADWLPPVGSGEVADIRFTRKAESLGTAHGRYSDFDLLRFTVDVEFPGDGNGLVEIPGVERLPLKVRMAPEDGYRQKLLLWEEKNAEAKWHGNSEERKTYCMRIRTVRNADGTVASARYAVALYGFRFAYGYVNPGPKEITFGYLANPRENDRNLECKWGHCLPPGDDQEFKWSCHHQGLKGDVK